MGGGSVQHGGHMHMGKQEQCEWVRAGQVDEGCGVGDVDARRTMRGRWRAAKRPASAAQLWPRDGPEAERGQARLPNSV